VPRFAANLHYLFNEHPFLDRFAAAADAGFRGVEAQVPYDRPAAELARRLEANGLEMALIDTPQGDWDKGERGLAALPGREAEFRDGIGRAIEYATALRCPCVHVIAGTVPDGADRDAMRGTYLANLGFAAEALAPYGVAAVIEPINPHMGVVRGGEPYTTYGMRGFYLTGTAQALAAIEEVGHPNLHLHLDVYHMQLTEGRLADTLRMAAGRREGAGQLRHLQVSSVPGRNEPDGGEVNYPYVFDLVDELGFAGWVGCEYRPRAGTLEGLGWAARYGIGPRARAGVAAPAPGVGRDGGPR
jgi:hydroxypyruvate isomerase